MKTHEVVFFPLIGTLLYSLCHILGGVMQRCTAVVRVGVLERGSDRTPVLEVRFPGNSALGQLRLEVARRFRVPVHSLELFREVREWMYGRQQCCTTHRRRFREAITAALVSF